MAEPFDWVDRPPGAQSRPKLPIVTVPIIGTVGIRFLDRPAGLMLHWDGARSWRCLGDRCPCRQDGSPPTWAGYAPAQLWVIDGERAHWQTCISHVTEETWDSLREEEWRGLVVTMTRPIYPRSLRVAVKVTRRGSVEALPESFDVRPYLVRRFSARAQVVPQIQDGKLVQPQEVIPFPTRQQRKGGA